MIYVNIAYPNNPLYTRISRFARSIYLKRLFSETDARPDMFVYATMNDDIVGCVGISNGISTNELFFEMCNPKHAYERLAKTQKPDRSVLCELGTRVVMLPKRFRKESRNVSIALTGSAIMLAHSNGIEYVGFVSNRMAHKISEPLGFDIVKLGIPDFSNKDDDFKENMKMFLRVKQYCFGTRLESITKCQKMLTEFKNITCTM